MEFSILDRIVAWVPGRWIRATKRLLDTEPYLADHFPGTPVLPGVLILEGMVQSGQWLLHLSEPGLRRKYAVESFRGVKFMRFVQPGETLEICSQLVDCRKPDGPVEMLCHGEVAGRTVVSARIRLVARSGQDTEVGDFFLPRGRDSSPLGVSPSTVQPFKSGNGTSTSEVFRWLWIDRFVEFQTGVWAEAAKQVPLLSGKPTFGRVRADRLTATLVLEGLAQTGGLLAFDATGFQLSPIMARIPHAEFYFDPQPGEVLHYKARLDRLGPEGARVSLLSQQADRLHAKVQILFALVGNGSDGEVKVDPGIFYRMMCESAAFEVPTKGRPARLPNDLVTAPSLASSVEEIG